MRPRRHSLKSPVVYIQAATPPVYLDPSKPAEQRVADLIGRMTLEEKMLHG
jgi:hypothetical protein